MRRRGFLQNLAARAAGISYLPGARPPAPAAPEKETHAPPRPEEPAGEADVEGYTFLCAFDLVAPAKLAGGEATR